MSALAPSRGGAASGLALWAPGPDRPGLVPTCCDLGTRPVHPSPSFSSS